MKKIIALTISLCLLCGIVALADTTITGASQSKLARTYVTTTVDEFYSVTIPASVPVAYGALSTELTLSVSAFRLAANNVVRVRTSSSGTLKNAADASKTIAYALKYNSAAFTSVDFSAVGDATVKLEITSAAWNAAAAGNYQDTITFMVSTATVPA